MLNHIIYQKGNGLILVAGKKWREMDGFNKP